jgi:two-component system, sensor histidine kinase and response regulator
MKRLLVEYRFIAVGVGLAILYWITESFLDLFDSAHEGATYIERLFASGDPNELRMLLITIILLIAFGVYAQTLMKDVKRAEEKFQDTQQKYRTLVERMPAVVYIQEIGSPDSAMYMSPQIETLTGYSPEDCKDPDLRWRMVHPDDRQRLQSEEETGEPGEVVATEYRVVHRDGQTKWVRNESVLVEVSGTRYWQGFMLDITERKEAERKQLEAETRYRTLVEHMPVIAYIVEPSCEENTAYPVVYMSPQVEGVLGYEAQQFVDDPGLWNKLIHPEDLQEVIAENQRTDERGEPFDMEYRMIAHDGRLVWVHESAVLVRDAAGRPLYWQGIKQDITGRKRAEEELKESAGRFRSTFENAPIGMALVSLDNHYRQVNQAFCDMLGYSQEELLSRRSLDVTHPDDLEASIDRTQALLEGTIARDLLEKRYIRADGNIVWALSSVSLVRDSRGDPAYFVSQYQNITERKRAEEDMKEANRRLEELAVLKADFTAMVAHELDTPLAVIRGYADMLATGELDIDEHSRALDRIQAETDLLEALVSDVRSAAAVETEDFAIKLQQVALDGLLRDAAAFVETLHGDHRLVTQGATDGWVLADPHRIRQVLRNLLSNAAKYSPDGTPIEVRTAPGATPGRVRIEVADRGPGIHPDDTARIFEKFGQGRDMGGRKVAGTGLGLYLSRRILQAHGSELTLDSEPGGGSVFGFELRAGR